MDDIQHRTTQIRSPSTNSFVEWMNRTLLDECLRVVGRPPWYLEPAEIERDLEFPGVLQLQRSHQGDRLSGSTPAQALQEALSLTDLPPRVPAEGEEVTDTAT